MNICRDCKHLHIGKNGGGWYCSKVPHRPGPVDRVTGNHSWIDHDGVSTIDHLPAARDARGRMEDENGDCSGFQGQGS